MKTGACHKYFVHGCSSKYFIKKLASWGVRSIKRLRSIRRVPWSMPQIARTGKTFFPKTYDKITKWNILSKKTFLNRYLRLLLPSTHNTLKTLSISKRKRMLLKFEVTFPNGPGVTFFVLKLVTKLMVCIFFTF